VSAALVVVRCGHGIGSRGCPKHLGVRLPGRPTPSVNISPCKWMDSSVIWRRSGFGDPSPVSVLDCSPLAPFPVFLSCCGNPVLHRLLRTFRRAASSQTSRRRYHVLRKINRSILAVGKVVDTEMSGGTLLQRGMTCLSSSSSHFLPSVSRLEIASFCHDVKNA
jgi:hypothetical protein